MSFLKKDDNGKINWSETFGFLPFLKKDEDAWDDGSDGPEKSKDDIKGRLIYIIMSIYGVITGFLGCQYCKYLHQRFCCYAWGVPLT